MKTKLTRMLEATRRTFLHLDAEDRFDSIHRAPDTGSIVATAPVRAGVRVIHFASSIPAL
jgi:hypothetical protein